MALPRIFFRQINACLLSVKRNVVKPMKHCAAEAVITIECTCVNLVFGENGVITPIILLFPGNNSRKRGHQQKLLSLSSMPGAQSF